MARTWGPSLLQTMSKKATLTNRRTCDDCLKFLLHLILKHSSPMDLLHAADAGRLSVVKELVSKDKSLIHTCRHKDASNRTFNVDGSPLHYACRSGHFNVVEYLLKQDSTLINDRDIEDWTPLHYACCNGHLNTVKLLVEYNADVRVKDNYLAQTPIQFAMYREFEDVVNLLDPNAPWIRRSAEEVSKKGNVPVFRKNSKLFLGRYRVNDKHVQQIQAFRADPHCGDIDLSEVLDVELNDLNVRIGLTHDFNRHRERTQELAAIDDGDDRFLRSSTTSTNEHIIVYPQK